MVSTEGYFQIRGSAGQQKEPRCRDYIPLPAPPPTGIQPWEGHIFSNLPFPLCNLENYSKIMQQKRFERVLQTVQWNGIMKG